MKKCQVENYLRPKVCPICNNNNDNKKNRFIFNQNPSV